MKELGWMPHVLNIMIIISGSAISYIYWLLDVKETNSIKIAIMVIVH